MTKLGQMLMEDGKAEGKAETLVSMIRRVSAKGMDFHAIAEMLELEEGYVKTVTELLTENPGKTDLEIAKMIAKEN